MGNDGLEFGEVIDDVAISLHHLLQLIAENVRFVSMTEMRLERGEEFSKRGHHRGATADRGNIPKFRRFGEEGSCYFDFTGFIGGIIDIIFSSYGPRVDGGKG